MCDSQIESVSKRMLCHGWFCGAGNRDTAPAKLPHGIPEVTLPTDTVTNACSRYLGTPAQGSPWVTQAATVGHPGCSPVLTQLRVHVVSRQRLRCGCAALLLLGTRQPHGHASSAAQGRECVARMDCSVSTFLPAGPQGSVVRWDWNAAHLW